MVATRTVIVMDKSTPIVPCRLTTVIASSRSIVAGRVTAEG